MTVAASASASARTISSESSASYPGSGSFPLSETVDVVENQVKVGGVIFRITVPGSGAVFLDVGRFIID